MITCLVWIVTHFARCEAHNITVFFDKPLFYTITSAFCAKCYFAIFNRIYLFYTIMSLILLCEILWNIKDTTNGSIVKFIIAKL